MAMASRIGRDLQAVPTQLHAAPAPRSLLAGVKENAGHMWGTCERASDPNPRTNWPQAPDRKSFRLRSVLATELDSYDLYPVVQPSVC